MLKCSIISTENSMTYLIIYNNKINIFHLILNHGVSRFGSRGNIDTFLMLSKPMYNMTTLSNPIPPPAWGGHP